MRTILHIDFNSFFASVEQQANPRLRGKPIGVTGGDRLTRTVLATASVEAKKLGVKTGMPLWEAKTICPQLIIICSDHEKYLSITTKFLNILKSYTPYIEVFSIDEAFLELESRLLTLVAIAQNIKLRLRSELGPYITCSIGISYNKLMAKLAGSLQKPDGLVVIPDQKAAIEVLDRVELDDICGIGPRIKKRLQNLGVKDFPSLRKVPKELLIASFKSYGETLYNMARGIDYTPLKTFYEKEEVKSVGHRHTIDHNTDDTEEIRQILLKLSEMIAQRLRGKNLAGKTIHFWYRTALERSARTNYWEKRFLGDGMQQTLSYCTSDGLEIFQTAWKFFLQIWNQEKLRMVGISVSSLKSLKPANVSLLPDEKRKEIILQAIDKVNNKFGDFTLQRGILLGTSAVKRKPNPFLSDRRFKL